MQEMPETLVLRATPATREMSAWLAMPATRGTLVMAETRVLSPTRAMLATQVMPVTRAMPVASSLMPATTAQV
jgi:hypothetical protein